MAEKKEGVLVSVGVIIMVVLMLGLIWTIATIDYCPAYYGVKCLQ